MEIFAFILALAAVICFGVAYMSVPPPRPLIPLGLLLLTVAWMVQIIVLTGAHLSVHN